MGIIPANTLSGVLPPFTGIDPTIPTSVSPYETDISNLVLRYATSTERSNILRGFIEYRKALRAIGIFTGFQWIDGSFVEDVEADRGRPPGDIDIVTFAHRPVSDASAFFTLMTQHPDIFDPEAAKETYHCDAYFVDLSINPEFLVGNTSYWFGLFSHRRNVGTWKGMIRIDLASDDTVAEALL